MCNVVLDVKAGAGHAFRYQGAGASIWSGEDWHVNDSGLMVAETSLSDGAAGNPRGVPSSCASGGRSSTTPRSRGS